MGRKTDFVADKEMSAAQAVLQAAPGLTRAKADLLIKRGEVRVNGARIRSNVPLKRGDVLCVFVPDSMGAVDVKLVYEDDNIAVFDKPKRVAYDAIPGLCGRELYAVHRLDTNTTGIIAFAKTEAAKSELERAFKDRRTVKRYEAVVYPAPAADRAELVAYTCVENGVARVSDVQRPGYKTMITEYEVKRRIGRAALLAVTPHTGRTHQIRAHLNFIGCPIVGDPKYGAEGKKPDGAPDTQMLAAVELGFYGLSGELAYLNGRTFRAESGFDISFLG